MSEELETVLRLVADGTLTPEQAAPIIDALTRAERATGQTGGTEEDDRHTGRREDRLHQRLERARRRVERAYERAERHRAGGDEPRSGARHLRIRVTERGRQVVNLRIPIGFVDTALGFVPGIGGEQSDRIRAAVASGSIGPILDVEDPDGDGVLISVE